MPGRTSRLPGTPACRGTAWPHPLWKHHPKPGPPALGVTLPPRGTSPNSQPSSWVSLGMPRFRARSSVAAGHGMVLTLDLALGGCQRVAVLCMCHRWARGAAFGQAPPPCAGGAAGKGSTGSGSLLPRPSCPLLGCGGGQPPPLTPAPLCLSGQDYGLSRSPPQFGSIYHVRGNRIPQCPLPWGERRMLSTGLDQAVPVPNWGSFPQPGASPCLSTHGDSSLVSCGFACSAGARGLGEGCRGAEASGLTHVLCRGPQRCH